MPSAAHHKNPEVHTDPKDGRHYRDDSASHHDEMPDRWNDPYYYDKIREHSVTGRIQGESGIGRIDAAAVPKFVMSNTVPPMLLIAYVYCQLYPSSGRLCVIFG